jgi:hypothetical protein
VKKLILLILFVILGLALILYGVGTVTAPVGNPIDVSLAGVPPAHTPTEPASVAPLIGIGEPDRDGLGYGKGDSYVLQKNFSSFRWF